MSINAISSIGSYYSSPVMVLDYETVKKQLQDKGIAPTGNENVDRSLLTQASNSSSAPVKNNSLLQNNASQVGGVSPQTQIPQEWQDLLAQLGLTSTGDINEDYDKATEAVKEKIKYAATDADRNKYVDLKSQIDDYVSNNSMNIASAASSMVGASMLANINKAMMIK